MFWIFTIVLILLARLNYDVLYPLPRLRWIRQSCLTNLGILITLGKGPDGISLSNQHSLFIGRHEYLAETRHFQLRIQWRNCLKWKLCLHRRLLRQQLAGLCSCCKRTDWTSWQIWLRMLFIELDIHDFLSPSKYQHVLDLAFLEPSRAKMRKRHLNHLLVWCQDGSAGRIYHVLHIPQLGYSYFISWVWPLVR
jgi:hypothetical protein